MKKILQLALSLTVISGVCAAVLATVNAVTKDQIAQIKTRAKQNAARLVLPKSAAVIDAAVQSDGTEIFAGRTAAGKAVAYALVGRSPKGYGGDIALMVGFTPDFTVITYETLEAAETPGLGSNLSSPKFMRQFRGLSATKDLAVTKDGGTVEAITSATITSRAVCDAVNNARAALQRALRGE